LFPESEVAETRREEQKLWLILFQVRALSARLNSLAFQSLIFWMLAILLGTVAIVMVAAAMLGPLSFLVVAIVVALFGLAAIIRTARGALRWRANPLKAASIADERAGLKGRLSTVLALAGSPRQPGLWSYLVEDTYGLREDFEPRRLEPHLVSRSIFALLGACLIAALILMIPAVLGDRRERIAAAGPPGQVTADIDNLDVRPGDPALEPNADIYANSETLEKLREKIAAAQKKDEKRDDSLSRWMDKARAMAGKLQGELLEHNPAHAPPVHLRLTDRNAGTRDARTKNGAAANPSSPSGSQAKKGGGPTQSHPNGGGGVGKGPPPLSIPGDQADQLAGNAPSMPQAPGPNQGGPGGPDSPYSSGGGGGSSHGAGADPSHLFGPPGSRPVGSDNFKITIDAQPSDESSSPGATGYIPPKIRVPLNPQQYPDEPLARSSVPSSDQATIRRVFER
jgi:hypothetical protein